MSSLPSFSPVSYIALRSILQASLGTALRRVHEFLRSGAGHHHRRWRPGCLPLGEAFDTGTIPASAHIGSHHWIRMGVGVLDVVHAGFYLFNVRGEQRDKVLPFSLVAMLARSLGSLKYV